MIHIVPIETIYKGRRFRSRLEARWAIFFDAIDIGWEYETEGFQIGKTKYLTDFKLLSFGSVKVDLFVEIKPRKPSIEEIKKCYEVSVGTNTDMLLICGTPGLPEFSTLGNDWNLKTGYVGLHFPAKTMIKGVDENTPFDYWVQSCRFDLFQTGPNGFSLDAWPIYFSINKIDSETSSYGILEKVDSKITEEYEVYGITAFGGLIRSHYFSSKPDGRVINHERLIYGYELATCARFEFDEFNLKMVEGFYRELELIPFKSVYSATDNAYALYYSLKEKKFISKETNEAKPPETITLVKRSPKLVIKQFVINYPQSQRTSDEQLVIKIWKGFLFRWRIQLKDLKLKRRQ
jgi:hypothetical protein